MQRGKNQFVSVSLCIRLRALSQSHCISWSIFTEIGTDMTTPKGRTSSLRVYRTTPSSILPPKAPILDQEVLKIHANMK